MKLLIFFSLAIALSAQSNNIQLCDQQATPGCITIQAPANLAAVNRTLTFVGGAYPVPANYGELLYNDGTNLTGNASLIYDPLRHALEVHGGSFGAQVSIYRDDGTAGTATLHIQSNNGGDPSIQTAGYLGTGSSVQGMDWVATTSRGAPGVRGAVQTGDLLGQLRLIGDTGVGFDQSGEMDWTVGSNWTGSNAETYLSFKVTPPSSTTLTESLRITGSGVLAANYGILGGSAGQTATVTATCKIGATNYTTAEFTGGVLTSCHN